MSSNNQTVDAYLAYESGGKYFFRFKLSLSGNESVLNSKNGDSKVRIGNTTFKMDNFNGDVVNFSLKDSTAISADDMKYIVSTCNNVIGEAW